VWAIIAAIGAAMFQSRAGFSECLDASLHRLKARHRRFNPVLGFLSVSTDDADRNTSESEFQSRAGFSECLD